MANKICGTTLYYCNMHVLSVSYIKLLTENMADIQKFSDSEVNCI